jgi:hypothetical protein
MVSTVESHSLHEALEQGVRKYIHQNVKITPHGVVLPRHIGLVSTISHCSSPYDSVGIIPRFCISSLMVLTDPQFRHDIGNGTVEGCFHRLIPYLSPSQTTALTALWAKGEELRLF